MDHFAIDEALDPRFAIGLRRPVGPRVRDRPDRVPRLQRLLRGRHAGVLRSATAGSSEVGAFIDEGGNNFWGVEQFTTPQGERLFAGSDRDYGLYLFRYTGPGSAQKPVCSDATTLVPFKGTATVPLHLCGRKCQRADRVGAVVTAERCPQR